ncbi:MAG: GNAT family N-acetyltransferase [Micavibrio sp.]
MPKQTKFNGTPLLYQSQLVTSPDHFTIAQLDKRHLPDIVALHREAIASLKDSEKAFMLLKKPAFFKQHFERANGNTVLGIITGNQLIGEAIVLHPSNNHPSTGMVDMAPVGAPGSITVLQGVTVLPSYRKNGLMHQMVHAWLNHALLAKKHHALAEVEVHNISSWSAFLNEGLQITGIGCDPEDGALLYNLHETIPEIMKKRLRESFNHAAANSTTCPIDDIKTQQDMLKNGYVISGWKKDSREFILTPR